MQTIMAIKQLKKITLYGPSQHQAQILQGMQSLGCLHLIPLTDKPVEATLRMQPAEASEAKIWLERSPGQRRQIRKKNTADIDGIVQEILINKVAFREQSDLRDKLEERIREVRPWESSTFRRCLN